MMLPREIKLSEFWRTSPQREMVAKATGNRKDWQTCPSRTSHLQINLLDKNLLWKKDPECLTQDGRRVIVKIGSTSLKKILNSKFLLISQDLVIKEHDRNTRFLGIQSAILWANWRQSSLNYDFPLSNFSTIV